MSSKTESPYLAAINLTKRCNLSCEHCYLDAGILKAGSQDELTTAEVCDALDQFADLTDGAMVVLTGGEPLLRPDLDHLAEHASSLGLMVVIGTNGLLLTPARVQRLIKAGVSGVGISLDSLDPEFHDNFRGRRGAWQKAMTAMDNCKNEGLAFQIHFSVMDDNAHELDGMIDFAKSVGALVLNIFFMVCTGRGEKVTNISLEVYERTLRRITEAAHREKDLMIRAKCAPHFKRMAMELDASWPITTAQGYEAGGCLAGTRYFRITPEGNVTACPYIEQSVGSVRETSLQDIWQDAPQFKALRAPKLEGRCGDCEYSKLCGGCRARPLARDGDLMAEDFLCGYEPAGGAIIEPLITNSKTLIWAADAEERLSRIPAFVRKMVRGKIEDAVRKEGEQVVTVDHMTKMAKARFGNNGMPHMKRPEKESIGDV